MADHPPSDGSDQRQRRKRCLGGAQRVDQRRNPFAVAECLRVNFPHSLVIFGPFLPDHHLDTSAVKVGAWSHGARLAPERSARDAIKSAADERTPHNVGSSRF
jgi:hypothetical protein